VYLAGGHANPWRQQVVNRAPTMRFIDPSVHRIADPAAYTAWDLAAVRSCDVVFAYFEKSNPSGYGLAVEVGYAAACGKHVILVDERSAAAPEIERYLRLIRHTATVVFEDLESGLDYLAKLKAIPWETRTR
jgi:nucleoside 2-deoxyribosyltransferase